MNNFPLGGRTSLDFELPYPPEVSFRYFAQNEDLLRQFMGPDSVTGHGDGRYSIRLNPHGAFGVSIRPVFDVQFIENPPIEVEMRSMGVRLEEASHTDLQFDADFTGKAQFSPSQQGTRVSCWAQMNVRLKLPALIGWMPAGIVSAICNRVISSSLDVLSHRLVPLMQQDIERWVAHQNDWQLPG